MASVVDYGNGLPTQNSCPCCRERTCAPQRRFTRSETLVCQSSPGTSWTYSAQSLVAPTWCLLVLAAVGLQLWCYLGEGERRGSSRAARSMVRRARRSFSSCALRWVVVRLSLLICLFSCAAISRFSRSLGVSFAAACATGALVVSASATKQRWTRGASG